MFKIVFHYVEFFFFSIFSTSVTAFSGNLKVRAKLTQFLGLIILSWKSKKWRLQNVLPSEVPDT